MAKRKVRIPTLAQVKAKIIAIDAARAEALNTIEEEFARLYSAYFDRVRSMIAAGGARNKTEALTLQNSAAMIQDLQNALVESGLESVAHRYGSEFPELARVAASYYEPFGLDDSLAGVPREFLAAWVDFSTTELVSTLDAALIPPIRSALLQANAGNMTRADLIAQIIRIQPTISTNDATVLVNDSFAQFQRAVIVQKGDAAGLEIYQYLGPDDDITSPQCQAMLHVDKHGAPGFLYKEEITMHLHPNLERYGRNPLIGGGHPRCFLPGTKIYGKILRASKSRYSGEAITIHTRKGYRLSVTANHPILTPRGFVPANLLNPGDEVVSYNCDIKTSVAATLTRESNEYDRPALIEDVFETIAAKGFLFRCRPTVLDLHGDAQPWNGDIDVVNMNRVLPLNREPMRLESDGENVLGGINSRCAIPVAKGASDLGFNGISVASTSLPSGPQLAIDQRGVGFDTSPLNFLTLGGGAFFDSAFAECALGSALSDAMLPSQLRDRFPLEILFDEIIAIDRHPYSGHVYDLESNNGWVIADGVCASNCRHQWSPVPLNYAEEKGFKPKGGSSE